MMGMNYKLDDYLKILVDAIKSNDVLMHEGLPVTVEEFLDEFNVKLTAMETTLHVDIAPKSGEGHDYMFQIDLETGKVNSEGIAIGEILPEPDFS